MNKGRRSIPRVSILMVMFMEVTLIVVALERRMTEMENNVKRNNEKK